MFEKAGLMQPQQQYSACAPPSVVEEKHVLTLRETRATQSQWELSAKPQECRLINKLSKMGTV